MRWETAIQMVLSGLWQSVKSVTSCNIGPTLGRAARLRPDRPVPHD
jgi:hypothetical protein